MLNKIYKVTGHYKKAGAVMLDEFSMQTDALAFARDAVDDYVETGPGDFLVSVAVTNKVTNQILSTFYPDFYEADSLDDDDDG